MLPLFNFPFMGSVVEQRESQNGRVSKEYEVSQSYAYGMYQHYSQAATLKEYSWQRESNLTQMKFWAIEYVSRCERDGDISRLSAEGMIEESLSLPIIDNRQSPMNVGRVDRSKSKGYGNNRGSSKR